MWTLIIGGCTALLVFLSVLFKPEIRIGKIKLGTYWIVSLIGAVLLLATGCLDAKAWIDGLTQESAVNPLKILVLFFSMTALSVFLDEMGFFSYLAGLVLRKAKGKQITLFIAIYAVVSVLTVFTSNDVVVLTFTPFICFFAKRAKINPLPYLLAEFVAANTWSMALIIGNPTNIYLASAAGIDFIAYAKVMILPTVAAGICSFGILYLLFRKSLKAPITVENTEIEKIADKPSLIVGVVHLALCTLVLTVSSYVQLEMWLIAACFTLSLFIVESVLCICQKRKPKALLKTAERLPFELVPFVLSMFTVVLALQSGGWTEKLADFLNVGNTAVSYGAASFLSANVINNIPMSVLFSSVLESGSLTGTAYMQGVYASVIGSNLGAYLTPVGALAGIMWTSILKKFDVKLSFARFIEYGGAVAIPTLAVALLTLILLL